MPVYIILITGSNREFPIKQVGAVYMDEAEAKAEVKRLNEANSFTQAYYVVRHVGK